MTPEEFYIQYLKSLGKENEFPAGNFIVDKFGDSPEMADELLEPVLSGLKTAGVAGNVAVGLLFGCAEPPQAVSTASNRPKLQALPTLSAKRCPHVVNQMPNFFIC